MAVVVRRQCHAGLTGRRVAAARALGIHEKYLLRVIKHLRID
jgi:hypothetical protein